jgi:MFS family permease
MSRLRIIAIFCSCMSQLVAYYLMMPFLLDVLQSNGVSSPVQGVFVAVGWSGVLVAMFTFRIFVFRFGQQTLFVVATVMSAVCAVFLSLFYNLYLWICFSFLSGLGAGFRWSLSEGMLLEEFSSVDGPSSGSGKIIGWFEAMTGVASVVGPLAFYIIGSDLTLTSRVVVFLYSLGAVIALFAIDLDKAYMGVSDQGDSTQLRIRMGPTLILLCIMSFFGGFYESGFMSIIPVFGFSIGYSIDNSSVLMILCGLGSALAMIPLGYFLDAYCLSHSDRLRLLALLASCVGLSSVGLFLFSNQVSVVWLAVFTLGAAGGGLFTVSIIILGTAFNAGNLLVGMSRLVLFYTLGSLVSSGVSGFLIEYFSHGVYPMFMGFTALIALISVRLFPREEASHRT